MRNSLAIVLLLLFFSGAIAQHKIIIKNKADFERKAEMVEVSVSKMNADFVNKPFVLTNENGVEVPYQLLRNVDNKLQSFIFQADVKAKSMTTYSLKQGKPSKVACRTHARFVPERMDDFAWENDLAAYRMYGPALAKDNPSNGIDLWLKRTADTVVNKLYRDELVHGRSYHIDHGDGLDCYKVGNTLGAGGIGLYQTNELFIGKAYDRYKVLENGPLRSTFTLYYDQVKIGKDIISQEITISTTAGSPLNKAVVKYSGKAQAFQLAPGITLHDNKGVKYSNQKSGIIAYAEDAVSDKGVPSGRNYVGVIIPKNAKTIVEQDNHLLVLANYKIGTTFTYYFGGGWSKWKFPTDKDWFDTVERFKNQLVQPLLVTVK
jgi:hypothetical protein